MQGTWARYMAGWVCGAALCAGCVPTEAEVTTQRAAVLGQSGDHTVSGPEVLNQYAVLAQNAPAGSSAIQVQDLSVLPGLKAGDVLFIIQLQGADIDQLSDAARFGTTLNGETAGHYEFVTVTSVDAASRNITVHSHGQSGLQLGYMASGHTQVIAVPQYHNLTVAAGATLSAPAWNGSTGGVVVVTADTLQLDGTISASGLGFRGGQLQNGGVTNYLGYRTNNSQIAGERGEGVGGSQSDYDLVNGRFGRGAAANGGGGGNGINAPGGGGANGLATGKTWTGQGVMDVSVGTYKTAWMLDPAYVAGGAFADSAGGGRGGYACSSGTLNPTTTGPDVATWLCGNRASVGGLGGRPLLGDVRTHLYFGGGGGAGQENDSNGGAGGSGGGLVFVLARAIVGQGQVSADGTAGGNAGTLAAATGGDGPGGGGGGGTVVLMAAESSSAVKVSAAGGAGGNHTSPNPVEGEGGGGGGGGGFVGLVGPSTAQAVVAGGAAGKTTGTPFAAFPPNGATAGAAGAMSTGTSLGPDFLPPVQAVDMQVTMGFGSTVRPGYTQTPFYTTYTNLGPDVAYNIAATITLPLNIAGVVTRNGDFTCTQQGQTVSCTLPSLGPNQSEVVEIFLNLPRDPQGPFSVSATVAGGGFDYVPTNNQAMLSAAIAGYVQLSGFGFGCTMSGAPQHSARAGLVLLMLPALLFALRRRGGRALLGLAGLLGASACSPTPVPLPTLQVMVTGAGSVASADGAIACGTQCQTQGAKGTEITLTAKPDSGQRFVNWDGRCTGTVPRCDLGLLDDATTTATFAPMAATCFDGIKNATETDVDCGGSCSPCQDSLACKAAADCQSAQCVTGICSSCPLAQELLINPGADAGATPTTYLPGWQVSTGMTGLPYNSGNGYPATTDPTAPDHKGYFFWGGNTAAATASQGIDLHACTTLINQGALAYQLSGYLGGSPGQDDNARVDALFQDLQRSTKTAATIGPVLDADRGGVTSLLARSTTGNVPAGTSYVFVTLTATRTAGLSNDGYADSLSLVLTLKP